MRRRWSRLTQGPLVRRTERAKFSPLNPSEHCLLRACSPVVALCGLLFTLLRASHSHAAAPVEADAVQARKKGAHTLGFAVGYADHGVADRAATALVYRGTTGAGRFDYAGEREHLRWGAALGFAMGPYFAAHHPDRSATFATVAVDGATESIAVPMRGRTMVPTASLGLDGKWSLGRWTLFAGATVDYELFYPQGFVTPGLMQFLGVKPALRLRVDVNAAHRFEAGITTPIAGWVVRMPYHQSVSVPGQSAVGGLVRLGSKFQGPGTLQAVGIDARYRYRINRRVGLTARYQFAWLRNEVPRLLLRADQQILLGVEVYL